jgi:hypothetical protein
VQAGSHPFNDPKYPQYPGTVNFFVDGQLVGTSSIADPADTVSITYEAESGGSATVTAQVIDSVLYEATSNAVEVNFSGGGGQSFTISRNGTLVTWNKVDGSKSYKVYWSGGGGPSPPAITNNEFYVVPAGSSNVYVEAYSGNNGSGNLIAISNTIP